MRCLVRRGHAAALTCMLYGQGIAEGVDALPFAAQPFLPEHECTVTWKQSCYSGGQSHPVLQSSADMLLFPSVVLACNAGLTFPYFLLLAAAGAFRAIHSGYTLDPSGAIGASRARATC